MAYFSNALEAKEFLASRILEEAQREHVALTEVERKMLYFSESDLLPDVRSISEEFDRTCDQEKYEEKIAHLAKAAATRSNVGDYERAEWQEATQILKEGDHYLSVLMRQAELKPRNDLLKLWITGFALILVLLCIVGISGKFQVDVRDYLPSREHVQFFMWASAAFIFISYIDSAIFVWG